MMTARAHKGRLIANAANLFSLRLLAEYIIILIGEFEL